MWLNQQLKLRHSTVDFVSKQTEILTKTQKGLKIKTLTTYLEPTDGKI